MDNLEAGAGPDLRGFREEVSGKFDSLELGIAWLRGQFINEDGLLVGLNEDMIALKDNVTVLEVNVLTVEAKVDKLQSGIDAILDRLPARAA